MAFHPNLFNTRMPPPNFPAASPSQFSSNQPPPCPTPPSSQHMFTQAMHVLAPNIPPPSFNMVTPNYLPISSPNANVGFVQPSIQNSLSSWNNTSLENKPPIVNSHNWSVNTSAVPYGHNNQANTNYQTFPIAQGVQVPPNIRFNSNNHYVDSAVSTLNPGNSQHHFNNSMPSQNSGFQMPVIMPTGCYNPSNNNYIQPPSNQSFVNINPINGNSNGSERNTWNQFHKTNVPDSSIFPHVNGNDIRLSNLSFSGNNLNGNNIQRVNVPLNGNNSQVTNNHINVQRTNAYKDNGFPMKQNDFIPLNGCSAPIKYETAANDSVNGKTNHSFDERARYYEASNKFNSKHSNRFNYNKPYERVIPNNSFKSEDSNKFTVQKKNNLIDIHVLSNGNSSRARDSKNNWSHSHNYSHSKFGSSNIEVHNISDSESVESISIKVSPSKNFNHSNIYKNRFSRNSQDSQVNNVDLNKNQSNSGWMSENIQKSLQKRNLLFKQAKTTNDPAVWEEYNKLKNEINEEIRLAKLNKRNTFNNNNNRKRNPRFEKNERNQNFPFCCDTCDRGFATEGELDSHNALHVKCYYTGCSFEAHPKIVSLHQKMQHDTGYAEAINKLNSNEEIIKWREERKRRFPTAENIMRKKAERAEKEARGEVIEEKDYGQFKKNRFENRRRDRFQKQRDGKVRKRNYNFFQKAPEIDLSSSKAIDFDSAEENDCHIKLPKFRGMKIDYINISSSDIKTEDSDDDASIENPISKVSIEKNSVSQEVGNDSDDDAPTEVPISKVPTEDNPFYEEIMDDLENNEEINVPFSKALLEQNTLDQQNIKESGEGDDRPLEVPLDKRISIDSTDSACENNDVSSEPKNQTDVTKLSVHENYSKKNENPSIREKVTSQINKDRKRERRPQFTPKPKHSLLRMLLSDEIRHERNVIMQCVRHVVRNNFFGIESDA